jgi:hypothetical protein
MSNRNNKVIVSVGFHLPTLVIEYLDKVFPNYEFQSKPRADTHTHPRSSIVRRVLETRAYNELNKITRGGWIVDIGGNPCRHQAANRANVWSCCPVISSEDSIRVQRNLDVGATQWCDHLVEKCTCLPNNPPSGYLMVHSIYYFTPLSVLKLVHATESGVLVSVHHTFDSPKGNFFEGEARYEDVDGTITMSVEGNVTAYRHPNPTWLREGYFSSGKEAMAWSLITNAGDTHVVKFVRCPIKLDHPVPVSTVSLYEAVQNKAYHGNVDMRPIKALLSMSPAKLNPVFEEISAPDAKVYSFLSHLVYTTGTRRLVIPKGALAEVTLAIQGRKRTPDTFQVAWEVTKKTLGALNMPADEVVQIQPIIAALAFTRTIEVERNALLAAVASNSYSMQTLNELMEFKGTYRKIPRYAAIATGAAATIGIAYLAGRRSAGIKRPLELLSIEPATINPKVLLALLGAGAIYILLDHLPVLKPATLWFGNSAPSSPSVRETGRPLPGYTPQTKEEPSILNMSKFQVTNVCPLGAKPKEMDMTASYHFSKLPFCTTGFGGQLVGFGVECRKPVFPRSCAHSEELALRNRMLMKQEVPESISNNEWMNDAQLHEMLEPLDFAPEPSPIKPTRFNEWVIRFPATKQAILRKAKQNLKHVPLAHLDKTLSKAFVKIEPYLKSFGTGIVDIKPRLIQGTTPEFQVLTGPAIHAYSKRLQEVWAPLHKRDPNKQYAGICYTSGLTANDLGTHFDACLARKARRPRELVILEVDCAEFDGSVTIECLKDEQRDYRLRRVPEKTVKTLALTNVTKGVTKGGIFYRMFGKRKSGQTVTSVGNSRINKKIIHTPLLKIHFTAELLQSLAKHPDPQSWIATCHPRIQGCVGLIVHQLQSSKSDDLSSVTDTILSELHFTHFKDLCDYLIAAYCSYLKSHGFKSFTRTSVFDDVEMTVLGDDNLTVTDDKYLRTITAHLETMVRLYGFKPKLIIRTNPFDAEFCSGRFWPSTIGTIWGPKIGRVISKTFWAKEPMLLPKANKHARAVALGMVNDTKHIPVLRTVIRRTLDCTQNLEGKVEAIKKPFVPHVSQAGEVCHETWNMMYHLYGLDKTQVLELEDYINQQKIPGYLNHPYLQAIIERDVPDETDEKPPTTMVVEPTGPWSVPMMTLDPSTLGFSAIVKAALNAGLFTTVSGFTIGAIMNMNVTWLNRLPTIKQMLDRHYIPPANNPIDYTLNLVERSAITLLRMGRWFCSAFQLNVQEFVQTVHPTWRNGYGLGYFQQVAFLATTQGPIAVYSLWGAPIAEELARRGFYIFGREGGDFFHYFIVAVECIPQLLKGNWTGAALTFCLHTVCRWLPLPLAVTLHAAWNHYALLCLQSFDPNWVPVVRKFPTPME